MDQSTLKRLKYDDGTVFDYLSKKPLTADELFRPRGPLSTTMRNIIIPSLSLSELGRLIEIYENKERVVQKFLFRIGEWKRRVQKDYPQKYEFLYDKATQNMDQYYADYLDMISENPAVKETYWKRAYEYLTQYSREFGLKTNIVVYRIQLPKTLKPGGYQAIWRKSLSNPNILYGVIRNKGGDAAVVRLDSRFDVYKYALATVLDRQQYNGTGIEYEISSDVERYSADYGILLPSVNFNSQQLLETPIAELNLNKVARVDWTEPFEYVTHRGITMNAFDVNIILNVKKNRYKDRYRKTGPGEFQRIPNSATSPYLVSNKVCAQCGNSTPGSECGDCGTKYCDKECQKDHWPRHQHECK